MYSVVVVSVGREREKEGRGDVVAQLVVKRRIRDPKIGGSKPACVRSTRKHCEFFSQKCCADSLSCAKPQCVHARIRIIRYTVKDPVGPCQSSVDYGNT